MKRILIEELNAEAKVLSFSTEDKTAELHILLQADSLANLSNAENFLLCTDYQGFSISAKRLYAEEPSGINGAIGQKPLGDYPYAEWLYLKNCTDEHNGYKHLWDIGMNVPGNNPGAETSELLETYECKLKEQGADFASDCIRTWFFIKDIDNNYSAFTKARKENFLSVGLTESTHYISSTGICGEPSRAGSTIQMDAYSIIGLDHKQVRFLYAPTHLNPTYEYGVTFERGTKIQYGDRAHIFISGTASIDNKGEVMHTGDIVGQTERMWENVETLLDEAGATFDDLMQVIVYIRNESDYETVSKLFESKFPKTPYIITRAAVCRPTWLIEMECIAITSAKDPRFRDF